MSRKRQLLFIFLVGVCLAASAVFLFPQPVETGLEYGAIAQNVANGLGYVGGGFFKYSLRPTSFLAPLYTNILALGYLFFGQGGAVGYIQFLQVIAFALSGVFLYLVALKLFKEIAPVAVLFYFLYLPLYLPLYRIWDTSFLILFVLIIVYLYLDYLDCCRRFSLWWLAIACGVGLLLNPIVFLLLFCCLLHLLIYKAKAMPARDFFILVFLPLLIISPWTIRNYVVHKHFVPIRMGLGLNFYLGNNPDATGTVFLKVKGRVPDNYDLGIKEHFAVMKECEWRPQFFTEIEEDQYLLDKFKLFVKNNPVPFLNLCLTKFYYFWWRNDFEQDTSPIFQLEYAAILLLALVGFWLTRLSGPRVNLFYLIFVVFSLVYSLTGPFFNWKYRLPIEPLLIVLAVKGLEEIKAHLKSS